MRNVPKGTFKGGRNVPFGTFRGGGKALRKKKGEMLVMQQSRHALVIALRLIYAIVNFNQDLATETTGEVCWLKPKPITIFA